jgi:murein DD-endopeptidase MepM/ murein hydrolase activator NlpD
MSFKDFILQNIENPATVIGTSFSKNNYVPIDLSESNLELRSIDVSSAEKLGVYINNYIKKNNAQVAYGGYLEVRNLYKRSNHFNNKEEQERNIHLGIDLWCAAETAVYTPLDATVHSFKNNTNYGDYGPTIILKHNIEGIEFYTLYGHLNRCSIEQLKVGQIVYGGEKIAYLGDEIINGNYPPHLHFQVINDLQGMSGDYPGVCSARDLEFYKLNCPDPELILKLK